MTVGAATRSKDTAPYARLTVASAFIRGNWLLFIALYLVLRVLLLVPPSHVLPQFQVAEGFLWLSCWVVEAAIIMVASRSGFSLVPSVRALPRTAQALAVVWVVAVLISTLGAAFPATAIRSATLWSLHGIFALAVWHLANQDRPQLARTFDRLVLALGWASVAAGLISMMAIYSIGIWATTSSSRTCPGSPTSDTAGISLLRR